MGLVHAETVVGTDDREGALCSEVPGARPLALDETEIFEVWRSAALGLRTEPTDGLGLARAVLAVVLLCAFTLALLGALLSLRVESEGVSADGLPRPPAAFDVSLPPEEAASVFDELPAFCVEPMPGGEDETATCPGSSEVCSSLTTGISGFELLTSSLL